MQRKNTRPVKIGNVTIGAGFPVLIQSMTNTDTKDAEKTVRQIKRLQKRGCEAVRASVYDMECAKAVAKIKDRIDIPFIADIHFDYRLAIAAMEYGADKIRINPGNLGGGENLKKVAEAANRLGKSIRVGVNSGSLEREILAEYGSPNAGALVKSALYNVKLLESFDFYDTVVSIKSSSVPECVEAYRLFSKASDYPLHIGVTEAGDYGSSIIKSSAALGALLIDGIGDTLRVSVTGDPAREVEAAEDILQYCGVRSFHPEIISCPTCARTEIDIEGIVRELKRRLKDVRTPLKIAVMGCVVNGPGEAREADIGIAGGRGKGALFQKGKPVKSVPEDRLLEELLNGIHALLK